MKGPGKFKSMNKQATYLEVKERRKRRRRKRKEGGGGGGRRGRRNRKRKKGEEASNISKYATVHYDVEM